MTTTPASDGGALGPQPAPLFDRRVPVALTNVLRGGGPFAWLTEQARRTDHPTDLGLRTGPPRATLYVGTTKVLDLELRSRNRFGLEGRREGGRHKPIKSPFDPSWKRSQDLAAFEHAMPHIRAYVEAAVEAVPDELKGEGVYQAALSRSSAGFTIVDREAIITGASRAIRASLKERLREPLAAAQAALKVDSALKGGSSGDKVDALALDAEGRVLAIEVKPGDMDDLEWTPVQVAMYAALLRAWIEPDQAHAAEVLEGMARQRAELGLGPAEVPRVRQPATVVPVIAVGLPLRVSEERRRRFTTVLDAVRAAGEPLTGLQLWAIEPSPGQVRVTGATELEQLIG